MITSPRNRRLKDIRRLRGSKDGRAVLDGPHLVAEAVDAGVPFEEVLITPRFGASEQGRRLAARLPVAPLEVAPELLSRLADADSPQGILAVVLLPRGGAEALPVVDGGVYLFADGFQDPGNLGAVARVAEAAGAAAMALAPGSVHPNHPRALRGAAGSLLRLPLGVAADPAAVHRRLAPARPRWLALVPRGGTSLYEVPPGGTLVLAVGAEGAGLSPALLERAESPITIPLAPPVESLNAAVAAAVALFELRRRRATCSAPAAHRPS